MANADKEYEQMAKNISSAGNISGTVDRAKRKALDIEAPGGAKSREIQNVTKTLQDTLEKLGQFTKDVGYGIKQQSMATAKATKEGMQQYSKAVKEDIRVDKKNLAATALSTATPVFGYFAAKFMETDVFQNAANKIKEKLGAAFSTVFDKVKTQVKGVFDPILNKTKDLLGSIGSKVKGMLPFGGGSERKGGGGPNIPKLAKGGYIGEAGLAKIHPAEVVAPSKEIMQRFQQTAVESTKSMHRTMIQERRSFLADFFNNFKKYMQGRTEEELSINQKILSAVRTIRTSLVSPVGGLIAGLRWSFKQALFEHPGLRKLVQVGKAITTLAGIGPKAVKAVFATRGNYAAQVRSVKGTPTERMADILAMMYPPLMHKLDRLIAVTKGEEEPTGKGWRIAGLPFRGAKALGAGAFRGAKRGWEIGGEQEAGGMGKALIGAGGAGAGMIGTVGRGLGGQKIAEAGRKTRMVLSGPSGWKQMAREKEEKQAVESERQLKQRFGPIPELLRTIKDNVLPMGTFYKQVAPGDITGWFGILGYLERNYDRLDSLEYSVTKDITEYAKETRKYTKAVRGNTQEIENATEKSQNLQEKQTEQLEKVNRRLGWQSMVRMMSMGATMIGGVITTAMGAISSSISALASAIIGRRAVDQIAAGGRGIGGAGKRGLQKLGGGSALKGLARGGGVLAGAGAIYKGVQGVLDAEEIFGKGETGGTERAAGGLGRFLGGKGEGGAKQAFKQASKWGAIGAAVGSFVPALGTALGGLAGAAFGAITGGIGGDRIARAFNSALEGAKSALESVWKGLKSAAQSIWGMIKSIASIPGKIVDKVWGWITGFLGDLKKPIDFVADRIIRIAKSIGNAIQTIINLPGNLASKAWNWITGGDKEKPKPKTTEEIAKERGVEKETLNRLRSGDGPGLAKGGIVEEGGVARIHKAEVVTPGSDILKSMESTALRSARTAVEAGLNDVIMESPEVARAKVSDSIAGAKMLSGSNEKLANKLEEVSKVTRENMQQQNAVIQNMFSSTQNVSTSSNVQNNGGGGGRQGQGSDDSIEKIYRGDIL